MLSVRTLGRGGVEKGVGSWEGPPATQELGRSWPLFLPIFMTSPKLSFLAPGHLG